MLRYFRRRPRTAAEWVARLQSGTVTASDRAALAAWLRQRPEHRAQLEAVAAIPTLASALGPRARRYLEDDARLAQAPGRRLAPYSLGLAAAVCVTLAIGLFWGLRADIYTTGIGESRVVHLQDGSTIWLNTNSRLLLQFDQGLRQVMLDRGEAYFSVAHDAGRPFVVVAGQRRIVVTGTQFDVLHAPSGVSVAVVEGHVRVESGSAAQPSQESGALHTAAVRLGAGQEAKFPDAGAPVIDQRERIERKSAWREGKIYLQDARLDSALEEVSRYSKTRLVLAEDRLAASTITGVFRTGDIDSVLFSMRELYGLNARRDGDRILLEIDGKALGAGS